MKTIIGNKIEKAAEFLRQGQNVAIPTETVYGLAGNAYNTDAVARIFEIKKRPAFNPLIVHCSHWSKISEFATFEHSKHEKLFKALSPGPLTVILEKKSVISDLVTAGLNTVAVRIPNHPLSLKLLNTLDFPLAAPSANPFGYISPVTAKHVMDSLNTKIPYILDGGNCKEGIESTIISFRSENKLVILRKGIIGESDFENHGFKVLKYQPAQDKPPEAPGMMSKHYAPNKTFVLGNIPELFNKLNKGNTAIISFKDDFKYLNPTKQYILSKNGSLREAAASLYSTLRALDKSGVDLIIAEEVPETGIGNAINDRLRRAASS